MDSVPQKRCTKCLVDKPLDHFCKNKATKDGLNPVCRECKRAYKAKWYAENAERERQKSIDYYWDNRDEVLPKRKQAARDKYATQREHVLAINKRSRERNKEKVKASKRDYHQRNKVKICLKVKLWAEENPERVKISRRNWHENNPDKVYASRQKQKALRKKVEGHHTAEDVRLQYKSQKGKCWHCGCELNDVFHVDHLVPIAKGGTNWPNNIVCSCSKCNMTKNAKLCQDWNGRLF